MYKASDFKRVSYKPGEAAKILGVTVKTIQNYDREGRLKVHRTPTNRRVIMREDLLSYLDSQGMVIWDEVKERRDVVYARVDESELDAGALETQALTALQSAQEILKPVILKDTGSGTDESRPAYRQLLHMVRDRQVRHIYVVSENILSESGFHTLQTMFLGYGTDIVVSGQE